MKKLLTAIICAGILTGTAVAEDTYKIGKDFKASGQVVAIGNDGIGIRLDKPLYVNNENCKESCGYEKGARVKADIIQVSWNHEQYRQLIGKKGSHATVNCTIAGAWAPDFKTNFVCAGLAD